MKKILLPTALIFFSTFSFSQDKTSFGFRAGLSSATLKGEAVKSMNSMIDYADGYLEPAGRTGFYGGVNASIPLGGHFHLEPGLYYTQKGYALKGDFDIKGAEFIAANAKASLNAQYLDLPVLLKAKVGGLEVFAGPQLSYLTNAKFRVTAGAFGFNVYDQSWDASEELNRIDAGLTGGIGYQFKNGFNMRATYDHGLTKADADRNMDVYNRGIKVAFGFNFGNRTQKKFL